MWAASAVTETSIAFLGEGELDVTFEPKTIHPHVPDKSWGLI